MNGIQAPKINAQVLYAQLSQIEDGASLGLSAAGGAEKSEKTGEPAKLTERKIVQLDSSDPNIATRNREMRQTLLNSLTDGMKQDSDAYRAIQERLFGTDDAKAEEGLTALEARRIVDFARATDAKNVDACLKAATGGCRKMNGAVKELIKETIRKYASHPAVSQFLQESGKGDVALLQRICALTLRLNPRLSGSHPYEFGYLSGFSTGEEAGELLEGMQTLGTAFDPPLVKQGREDGLDDLNRIKANQKTDSEQKIQGGKPNTTADETTQVDKNAADRKKLLMQQKEKMTTWLAAHPNAPSYDAEKANPENLTAKDQKPATPPQDFLDNFVKKLDADFHAIVTAENEKTEPSENPESAIGDAFEKVQGEAEKSIVAGLRALDLKGTEQKAWNKDDLAELQSKLFEQFVSSGNTNKDAIHLKKGDVAKLVDLAQRLPASVADKIKSGLHERAKGDPIDVRKSDAAFYLKALARYAVEVDEVKSDVKPETFAFPDNQDHKTVQDALQLKTSEKRETTCNAGGPADWHSDLGYSGKLQNNNGFKQQCFYLAVLDQLGVDVTAENAHKLRTDVSNHGQKILQDPTKYEGVFIHESGGKEGSANQLHGKCMIKTTRDWLSADGAMEQVTNPTYSKDPGVGSYEQADSKNGAFLADLLKRPVHIIGEVEGKDGSMPVDELYDIDLASGKKLTGEPITLYCHGSGSVDRTAGHYQSIQGLKSPEDQEKKPPLMPKVKLSSPDLGDKSEHLKMKGGKYVSVTGDTSVLKSLLFHISAKNGASANFIDLRLYDIGEGAIDSYATNLQTTPLDKNVVDRFNTFIDIMAKVRDKFVKSDAYVKLTNDNARIEAERNFYATFSLKDAFDELGFEMPQAKEEEKDILVNVPNLDKKAPFWNTLAEVIRENAVKN